MAEVNLSWVLSAMGRYIEGSDYITEWDQFEEYHLLDGYRIVNDLEDEDYE